MHGHGIAGALGSMGQAGCTRFRYVCVNRIGEPCFNVDEGPIRPRGDA